MSIKIQLLNVATVFCVLIALVSGPVASANESDKITLKITELNNLSGGGALEACGTAVHKDGIKPIMVTIKHDQSFYTVLTAPNDKWCVVFKRWNYNGNTEASATTLQKPSEMNLKPMKIQ